MESLMSCINHRLEGNLICKQTKSKEINEHYGYRVAYTMKWLTNQIEMICRSWGRRKETLEIIQNPMDTFGKYGLQQYENQRVSTIKPMLVGSWHSENNQPFCVWQCDHHLRKLFIEE